MPQVNQVQARKPSTLDGGTSFHQIRTIDTDFDSVIATTADYVAGINNRRGVYYAEGAAMAPSAVLFRASRYPIQSDLFDLGRFRNPLDTGGVNTILLTAHSIDNVLWLMGSTNGSTVPLVSGVPFGGTFTNVGAWVSHTTDVTPAVYANAKVRLMVKAADAGFLYFLAQETVSTLTVTVMRCTAAGAPANAFSAISAPLAFSGSTPSAFGVRPDGQTQIIASNGGPVYRSSNGGASFTSITATPASGGYDVHYSKAYRRWFIAGFTGGAYSDADGATGTWAASLINGAVSSEVFSSVESLDSDGRYYLGVMGGDAAKGAAIQTYISEDGGKNWFFTQSLLPPYFNTTTPPASGIVTLLNTGSKILIYQASLGVWNYDNGLFESGAINL